MRWQPTTPETAKAAETMKKDDVKDFASTKHKGLPDKKDLHEESNPRIPRKKGQPANSKSILIFIRMKIQRGLSTV